jgi:hypothetical protein
MTMANFKLANLLLLSVFVIETSLMCIGQIEQYDHLAAFLAKTVTWRAEKKLSLCENHERLEFVIQHKNTSLEIRTLAYCERGDLCMEQKQYQKALFYLRLGVSIKEYISKHNKNHLNRARANLIDAIQNFSLPYIVDFDEYHRQKNMIKKLLNAIAKDYVDNLCDETTYCNAFAVANHLQARPA